MLITHYIIQLYNYLLIRLGISANKTLQKPKGFPIIVESPQKWVSSTTHRTLGKKEFHIQYML